jgi:single-stranded-DNA-specific exonuclease
MGRMEYAMDSLRLLCSTNRARVKELVEKISETNKKRQTLTIDTTVETIEKVKKTIGGKKLIFISDKKYNQGIIGLVAGKLVEEFYLPSIVVSEGEALSKASARSVKGFNIVDFIRLGSDFLVDVGGHPMAAGFTVETKKLIFIKNHLEKEAEKLVTQDLLIRELTIDFELPFKQINLEFVKELEKLAPFGPSNPTPVFLSKNLTIEDMRLVGQQGKHLKITLSDQKSGSKFGAIAFGFGKKSKTLKIGDTITIVYTLAINEWNGNERIEIKIKDLFRN